MRIAIDTGGTFTDCVYVHNKRLEILKLPSTLRNPAEAIAYVLDKIQASDSATDLSNLDLVCGTTVGTNALLQRQGGRVALVTTAGFEDVLEIGRQTRPLLYDLSVEKMKPLIPPSRRFGLAERLNYEGRVLLAPSAREINRIVGAVSGSGAKSVAVCLLFSFVNPGHEKAIARSLTLAGFQVSVSHQILPEYREFERTSTTVVNAYLVPVMSRYLAEIEKHAIERSRVNRKANRRPSRRLNQARVRVMQSNGGIASARAASDQPVRTILSGPAGGVLGAQYVAEISGFERIITFDMGGTSTDVALMDTRSQDSLATTSETVVSDLPVAVPMLDIHTVGAGGGSRARFDRAGALRVGPESAGADPGPICYGQGEIPTVTDANLVLGRIPASGLLGGAFKLDSQRARDYMERARGPMSSVEQFAQGILEVANTIMGKAVRVISVERGHDPRDYTLVAFGGAGGLHACDLAAALEMPRVLVPCFPGALSALGILRADVTKDLSRTIRKEVRTISELRPELLREFAVLEREGRTQMRAEGFDPGQIRIERALDMRYAGQSYSLTVPMKGNCIAAFHRAHERRYGYSDVSRVCEVVTVRARFIGRNPKPDLPKIKAGGPNAAGARVSKGNVRFSGHVFPTTVYDRPLLRAGTRIPGPAIVMEYSATTVIPPTWNGRVDSYGNIILEPRR